MNFYYFTVFVQTENDFVNVGRINRKNENSEVVVLRLWNGQRDRVDFLLFGLCL